MPLTDDQRRAIRDEEMLRQQVQQEIAGVRPLPTFFERVSAFFDSKAGFWLLTTALAGLATTGFTGLQQYLNRQEIMALQEAERALRDVDTLLKVVARGATGVPAIASAGRLDRAPLTAWCRLSIIASC